MDNSGIQVNTKELLAGTSVRASDLAAWINAVVLVHGDMLVFQGDKQAVQLAMCVACEQPEEYGKKYIHFGDH
jgi:hypothetical protein